MNCKSIYLRIIFVFASTCFQPGEALALVDSCSALLKKYKSNLRELFDSVNFHSNESHKKKSSELHQTWKRINKPNYRCNVSDLSKSLGAAEGTVLVLLPPDKENFGEFIRKFLSTKSTALSLRQVNLIFRPEFDNPISMRKELAQNLALHDVSLIIGGTTAPTANTISYWAEKLSIPAWIINTKEKVASQKLRYTMFVYPQLQEMQTFLTDLLLKRGTTRVVALSTSSPHSQQLAGSFAKSWHHQTGTPIDQKTIDENDYTSIEHKVTEWATLSPSARPQAVYAPVPVSLARHLARIFKFKKLDDIRLIGPPQWRTNNLVSDSAMRGSLIVDIFGDTSALPPQIKSAVGKISNTAPPSALDQLLIAQRIYELLYAVPTAAWKNKLKLQREFESSRSLSFDQETRSINWKFSTLIVDSGELRVF